jgi:fucose permease
VLRLPANPRAAGVLGCVSFLMIGWAGLLVPSLIRSIEHDFNQTDAGMGTFYFLNAVAYASGSFGGGIVTERIGRRRVLLLAAASMGIGLATIGAVPLWAALLIAAIPAGFGAGAIDGGVNGLILDLFPEARGRALNTLHLFYSIGALSSPLIVGQLVEAGVPWQSLVLGTAAVTVPVGVLFAVVVLPHGRRAAVERVGEPARERVLLSWPLVALGIAIACYVASEIGVSSWLVRFLDAAPLALATGALSLFWAGLALGRLVSARFSDRFDHLRLATLSAAVAGAAIIAAVLVPSTGASIALFAVVGFASGPVFPLIIAIGGERHPDRSAAVSGFLTAAAVAGGVVYPPVMGFLSVNVGLVIAMLGTGILGVACAGALLLATDRPAQKLTIPQPGFPRRDR